MQTDPYDLAVADRLERIVTRNCVFIDERDDIGVALTMLSVDLNDLDSCAEHPLIDLYQALHMSSQSDDIIYLSADHRAMMRAAVLFLRAGAADDGFVTSAQLSSKVFWRRNPLLFLNACQSLAFSPKAISPFITKFVADRGAAAVIGTEIKVWEQLATEVGLSVWQSLVRGDPVGEALLTARRSLLAKRNPVGLAYTLYGPLQLKLDRDGDGQC